MTYSQEQPQQNELSQQEREELVSSWLEETEEETQPCDLDLDLDWNAEDIDS